MPNYQGGGISPFISPFGALAEGGAQGYQQGISNLVQRNQFMQQMALKNLMAQSMVNYRQGQVQNGVDRNTNNATRNSNFATKAAAAEVASAVAKGGQGQISDPAMQFLISQSAQHWGVHPQDVQAEMGTAPASPTPNAAPPAAGAFGLPASPQGDTQSAPPAIPQAAPGLPPPLTGAPSPVPLSGMPQGLKPLPFGMQSMTAPAAPQSAPAMPQATPVMPPAPMTAGTSAGSPLAVPDPSQRTVINPDGSTSLAAAPGVTIVGGRAVPLPLFPVGPLTTANIAAKRAQAAHSDASTDYTNSRTTHQDTVNQYDQTLYGQKAALGDTRVKDQPLLDASQIASRAAQAHLSTVLAGVKPQEVKLHALSVAQTAQYQKRTLQLRAQGMSQQQAQWQAQNEIAQGNLGVARFKAHNPTKGGGAPLMPNGLTVNSDQSLAKEFIANQKTLADTTAKMSGVTDKNVRAEGNRTIQTIQARQAAITAQRSRVVKPAAAPAPLKVKTRTGKTWTVTVK